jgi:RNA polymerase sigma-70 factor (ECF subfamily)
MLGNPQDTDDPVQETWLRLAAADTEATGDLAGWFTTVISRGAAVARRWSSSTSRWRPVG